MRKAYWSSTVSSLVIGPLLILLCLRQWGTDHPWSRLDFYSGSFLVLAMFVAIEEAFTFARSAYRNQEVAQEALGLKYDSLLFQSGKLLTVAVLLLVLDYAHWHLVPALVKPVLQGIGVALGVIGVAWQTWADSWLARHFVNDSVQSEIMTEGPFRFVRHPRYTAFLLRKLAWPLLFASVIGWALLAVWVLLIIRRIRREESHLAEIFGSKYTAYAGRTARLIPGMY